LDEILRGGFAAWGLTLHPEALARFSMYYRFLTERNQVMNLTAITGEEETARQHFLDCAALLRFASFRGASVVDVGSGAGFPGLVLKMAEPTLSLTLIDSQKKRVDFLRETCELLGLKDVVCVHARAEEAIDCRESFEIAVSRAVARLNVLCELCLPLVRPGGLFLAMKGPDSKDEEEEARGAMHTLGGVSGGIFPYTVPGTAIAHSVVSVRKTGRTPERYPRRFARIQKQPL
jgi:16S rRNA (guanine527-N7)-methyltransferase